MHLLFTIIFYILFILARDSSLYNLRLTLLIGKKKILTYSKYQVHTLFLTRKCKSCAIKHSIIYGWLGTRYIIQLIIELVRNNKKKFVRGSTTTSCRQSVMFALMCSGLHGMGADGVTET